MSAPDDELCYVCQEYEGTEECPKTGYSICRECLDFLKQRKARVQ